MTSPEVSFGFTSGEFRAIHDGVLAASGAKSGGIDPLYFTDLPATESVSLRQDNILFLNDFLVDEASRSMIKFA